MHTHRPGSALSNAHDRVAALVDRSARCCDEGLDLERVVRRGAGSNGDLPILMDREAELTPFDVRGPLRSVGEGSLPIDVESNGEAARRRLDGQPRQLMEV